MNIRRYLFAAVLSLGCLSLGAQELTTEVDVEETVFVPHTYVQAQVGFQETLGEASFGKLMSPNVQVAVGHQFNPLFGARFAVNAWRSRAQLEFMGVNNWHWSYLAPSIDGTFNLTNFIGGFKPERKWDVNLFAGIGMNIAWGNDEAVALNSVLSQKYLAGEKALRNIWDGTKIRFVGRFGAAADYAVSDHVKVGIELQANVLSDGYNSKRAGNADWYFNCLAGVKYTFGPTYAKRTKKVTVPAVPVIQERIVEKIVEVPVEVPVPVVEETEPCEKMRRDVYFTINRYNITTKEMTKVKEIADYLKANPDSKVIVAGYADKGTGTLSINLRLSLQRADAVVNALTTKYGIAADRITKTSMGEAEDQPNRTPAENRVVICVVME